MSAATKYETDFYGWAMEQANLLKHGQVSALDLENLIEEIEGMGKSQANQLHNRLELLLMHLLKWQYQPNFQGSSWQRTINEQRRRIAKHIGKNPSLKAKLDETYLDAYDDARNSAALETGLDLATFPELCQWSFEQAMNPEFMPD
ncbi:DUF29 domain-containing protein [Thiothrix subterranea]|uniref:DUF29 domain-containing protein n=1 Tax=Thiothrix subterranea TaxID=2735563 RepID=A0AA51QX27_9GAMM|nr:DUF29 domain-containing protein [Thiothrix subterranea]MDQ5770479.1 DUF29 domain-containing protein [Thiothrix subterranea]WML86843.1 DUF29 domain-containing protein [Thiothrix subterranea]